MLKTGKYRHYKGNFYEVLGVCYLAGPATECVLYRQLYDAADFPNGTMWARPVDEFFGKIVIDGVERERYEYVPDALPHPTLSL